MNVTPVSAMMLVFAGLISSSLFAQAQTRVPLTRVIPSNTQSIEERLLPGDDVVLLESDEIGADGVGIPTVNQMIDGLRKSSDAVVLAEVAAIAGTLALDGTRIHTRVSAKTIDVFVNRNPGNGIGPGKRLDFEITAGEIMLGDVLVKTRNVPQLKTGSAYLFFLDRSSAFGAFALTHPGLMVQNGRVTEASGAWSGYVRQNPLVGQSVARIAARLRRQSGEDDAR